MRVDPAVADRALDRLVAADPDHKQVKMYRRQAEEAARAAEREVRNFGAEQAGRTPGCCSRRDSSERRPIVGRLSRRTGHRAGPSGVLHLGGSGRSDAQRPRRFGTVVVDEAGQALEPGAWIPVRLADRVVLAGDACQLPADRQRPRRLESRAGGELVEKAIARERNVHLLDTQYRMHADIMAHPNRAFYQGALQGCARRLGPGVGGGCTIR